MPITITLSAERFRLLRKPRRIISHTLPLTLSVFALSLAACGSKEAPVAVAPTNVPTPQATAAVATPTPDIAPTLKTAYNAFSQKPLTLTFEGRTWQPTSDELGANVSIERDHLKVAVDRAKLRAYFSTLASAIAQPATDAGISLVEGKVVTTPAAPGRELDMDAAVAQASAALERAEASQLTLSAKTVEPKVGDEAAAQARGNVQKLLAKPFELTVSKKVYRWKAETLAPLLRFNPKGDDVEVTFDRDALAQQVKALAEKSERPAQEPRVAWNGGNLRITGPGEPGTRIDEAKAIDTLIAALASNSHSATLPLQTTQPRITEADLPSLGIKDVISVGKSDFTGSAEYRITNILAGMKLLNGVLIGPGQEFSFNNTVGEIDASNGFVEGHAIVNNRTQLEFGGGICQDSTTVFRAAFWAGLPITERKEHTFYINWYDKYGLGPQGDGPGLDAAIYTGVQDMRFMNDTGHWLLLEARADPKAHVAQVTLYGTKPNRTVSITQEIVERKPKISRAEYYPDPQQPRGKVKRTDTARGGMTIEVYRTITENGTQREPELFRTVFRPWSDKYAVNPADLGPDGFPNFLRQSPTITPTVDPATQPTADPNMPPPPPMATIDPNAPQPAPVEPTPDPNAQQASDPNAQPAANPEGQPVQAADPNAPPASPAG